MSPDDFATSFDEDYIMNFNDEDFKPAAYFEKVLAGTFHTAVLVSGKQSVGSKARVELPPAVKPKSRLKRLNGGDPDFENDKDVVSDMQRGVNIAGMDPGDFEHLVRQVFVKHADKMLGCTPGDVTVGKVTKVGTAGHQGDRGIDCVIQDLRPIVGQKIVVQAKCYTATVGVEAVRAFHTSVLQHKANKGIMITTTTFGPESCKVANEFGNVELMNGAELVGLMQLHDIPGYCDPKEVRDKGEHTLESRKARKTKRPTLAAGAVSVAGVSPGPAGGALSRAPQAAQAPSTGSPALHLKRKATEEESDGEGGDVQSQHRALKQLRHIVIDSDEEH
eukprot:m.14953 g.14953  ORF g.14953 m.14953 type:complete len:334 (-) comp3214_c0_seq1:88-1089(-)